jgi:pimeloyl-ACP methyl ester carboxylesterase
MPHVSPQRLRQLKKLFSILQAISPRLAARLAFFMFLTPVRRKLDASDVPLLASARHHELLAGADRVHVHEWGIGPRTAVILHGWGSHAPRFARLAQALVAQGWRVQVIDAPGHGRSPGRTSSLPQFIRALDTVIRELGPAQALIGHSLGALAAALWLDQPEGESRTQPGRAEIRQAVLISTPSDVRFLVDNFVAMLGLNATTTRHVLARFADRFGDPPETWSAVDCAAGIRIRVLLVHDRDDDVVPFAHSEQLLARLPQARLHVTQGLGHSGMLRDASTISAICQELNT